MSKRINFQETQKSNRGFHPFTKQLIPKPFSQIPSLNQWQILPSSDELPDSDDTPVDNELHTLIPYLLRDTLSESWKEHANWFFGINMGIYHTTGTNPRIPIVPDAFLSLDVISHKRKQGRPSYVVWEENGIVPIFVLECVSHAYGKEYDAKMHDYARLGVLYYLIYNPDYFQRDKHEPFEIYRLEAGKYVRCLGEPVYLPEIGLGIGRCKGEYQRWQREWLYWYTKKGTRLPSPVEQTQHERRLKEQALQRAEIERQQKTQALQRVEIERQQKEQALQHAEQVEQQLQFSQQLIEQERQQKEQAIHRAESLAKLLQEMGVDPNHLS